MNDYIDRDEDELGRILRAAGPRPVPGAEATAVVRAAVQAEWLAVVADRERQRRPAAWFAAAAAVGALAVGWWLTGSEPPVQAVQFAAVAHSAGMVERRTDGGDWQPVAAGMLVSAGDRLRTGADGRVALAVDGGPSLRLDRGTEVAVADATHLTLSRGATYVDSHGSPRELVVETSYGVVTHVGTRYQARVVDDGLAVAVRDGQVRIARDGDTQRVQGGERLVLSAAGAATRTPLAPYATDWAWAETIVPPPAIDGMTLHEFVEWAARETGRVPVFATPAAEQAARGTVLHGSVTGLTPQQALDAMLRTTRLAHDIDGGSVILRTGSDSN